jgi:hypothetical protein
MLSLCIDRLWNQNAALRHTIPQISKIVNGVFGEKNGHAALNTISSLSGNKR